MSMMPLVERLTMGSCAGTSGSLFTNDSLASVESATRDHSSALIRKRQYHRRSRVGFKSISVDLNIEPRCHPDVLDSQRQAQQKFHRHREQYTYSEKLKSQILQQTCSG